MRRHISGIEYAITIWIAVIITNIITHGFELEDISNDTGILERSIELCEEWSGVGTLLRNNYNDYTIICNKSASYRIEDGITTETIHKTREIK